MAITTQTPLINYDGRKSSVINTVGCFVSNSVLIPVLISRSSVVRTFTGLHIETSIDYAIYEKGIEVNDEELELLNIKCEKFHGEWNYMIKPQV
jgi:Rhodopirellula transposase.